jgi:subtilisin family serine protease
VFAGTVMGAVGRGTTTPTDSAAIPPAPDELLVRYRQGAAATPNSSQLLGSGAAGYNPRLDVWKLRLPAGMSVDEAVAQLRADSDVVLAQPNYRYVAARAPNDPSYGEWQHPYYAAVNAPAGWEVETGNEDVLVAILDGGVNITHPELDSTAWTNPAETLNGIDDDGNGCIDDTHGCNFQGDPPNGDIDDRDGHGTFVAGIIAAESDNGYGVAGIAWSASIMPVRVLDPNGIGTTEQLAGGILYAAENGADVANLSLALVPEEGTCPDDPIVEDALRIAHDDFDLAVLAAAGNFNMNCVAFPAASPYTIAVGGAGPPTDPDVRAPFSQWGPEVDLAAPAVDIFSTLPDDNFGTNLGTSFATPIVAGAAALLLSQESDRTVEELRTILRDTARDMPDDLHPNWDGAGMLNLGAALGGESTFATFDVTAGNVSDLAMSVLVGDPDAPLCATTVWNQPQAPGASLHGSFGLDQCGMYWPPTSDQPWTLRAAHHADKTATLHAWSVRVGDTSCAATDLPAVIPRSEGIVSTIRCLADGIVTNDRLEGATRVEPFALPHRFTQDLRYATSSGDPAPSCADSFSRSAWYSIAANGSGSALAADTFGTEFDTVLALYVDGADGLSEVACNDDFGSPQSRLIWRTDGTSDFYVMAAAFQAVPAGRLNLNISAAFIPANDSVAEAAPVSVADPYPIVQPAHSATAASDDPPLSCVTSYGFSLWFETQPDTPAPLAIDTAGSNYDTVLAIFRRDASGSLIEVACNDDDTLPGTRTSSIILQPTAGESYAIVVGSFSNRAAGAMRLSVKPTN